MDGQQRRAWLNRLAMDYIVPMIPPEMRGQVQAAEAFNPVSQIGDSMAASARMYDSGLSPAARWQAAGDMASGIAGVVAPMGAARAVGGPVANALAGPIDDQVANVLRKYGLADLLGGN